MRNVYIKPPKRKEYHPYMVGDVHLGAMNCQKEAFLETLRRLKKDRNGFMVLMGDLLDSIVAGDKRFNAFERDHSLPTFNDQVDWIYSSLESVKKKQMWGIVDGNHESKLSRRVGYDFSKKLADDLDIEYLDQISVLNIDCRFRQLVMLVTHGIGAPMTVGGQINKLRKLAQNFEHTPDIITVGHYHRLDSFKFPVLDNKMETKIKMMGFSGSYFKAHIEGTSNYAVNKWYPPTLIGYLRYKITRDDIQCDEMAFK